MRTLESLLGLLVQEVDQLGRSSHERALANAREAATELSRQRVEREAVDLFLADHGDRPPRTAARRRVTRTA
jgi:hypothetical protein